MIQTGIPLIRRLNGESEKMNVGVIVAIIVFLLVALFVMGAGEIEQREERWRRAHPPDEKGGGGE